MPTPLSFLSHEPVPLPVDDIYFWLDYFEQYLAAMEGFIEKESITIQERHRDSYEALSNAEVHLEALEDFFPAILRRSFFTAAYSLAEAELDDRCRTIRTGEQLLLSHSDLKGHGIPRAKTYLTKVVGITFPDSLKSLGDEIGNYRKLRNCFAHNQNRLTSNKDGDHLRNHYIPSHRQHIHLGGLEGDEIILRRGFCEEVIKTFRAFFQELDKAEQKAAQTGKAYGRGLQRGIEEVS